VAGSDSRRHRVFIAIGSNIEPEKNVSEALSRISVRMKILDTSTFYRTKALGGSDQPDFINGVALATTDLEARALKFDVLRPIEQQLGRARTADSYAPRTIDLDILLFDDAIICAPDLMVPDANLWERAFLARCVVELDPEIIPPDRNVPLREAPCLVEKEEMCPLAEFSMEMKRYRNE
jgi:2-amino-4-hydroxy-6-hydroxymethyldihydropteridine diphosphokinase